VRVTSDAPDEAQYEPAGCVVIHEVDLTLRSLILDGIGAGLR
jgi:hypothetical protein